MKPLTLFLLAALSSSVFANGGGFLQGVKSTGPFRPVNVEQVQMVSESLDIELREDSALVNITYVLHNPGKAVKVEMGFPCSVAVADPNASRPGQPPPALPQLKEFQLFADDKPLTAKLMQDHAVLSREKSTNDTEVEFLTRVVTGWQVVSLPFSSGQTRLVRVSYANPWFRRTRSVSDDSYSTAPSMRYLFSAAALWNGPIRKGTVTIRATGVSPELVKLSHPKRFRREGAKWTWEFTDFEPALTDDLEIVAGDTEMTIGDPGGKNAVPGRYTVRGSATDFDELQKTGRWSFTGNPYTASASSSLKPDAEYRYGPENLCDRDWSNAWVEGADGDGIGESISLTMKSPQKATALVIYNGYSRSRQTFMANNRVRTASVSLNGGTPFTVEFKDTMSEPTRVKIPADTGMLKTVKLTIQSVYRGESFRDTCITGVEVEAELSKRPRITPAR